MPISGNPKKLAQDIRDGFLMISPPQLKSYSPQDMKIMLSNLAMVTRELRQVTVPLDDIMALKKRNMQLGRLRQSETIIRSFCKKRRIPV
jgi:hypothetical protein